MDRLLPDKQRHKQEVKAFFENHFSRTSWDISCPGGSGNETYIVRNDEHTYFVKLNTQAARVQAMAAIGLSPQVLAAAYLEDGTSILVQPYITGRNPTRRDYRIHLEQFAAAIHRVHHCREIQRVLPETSSDSCKIIGLEVLTHLRQRWERYKALVPEAASFIDASLAHLEQQIEGFQGTGLVASHNDICNANWLITPAGQLFLVDLESMSMEDPAVDLGATLWWYYPPDLRSRFLQKAGYAHDRELANRMQVRMSMHCLNILLPREQSFDRFDPDSFCEALIDFRACFAGEENPQGYADD